MADFLEEKRKEIQARLKALKPAVDEYQLLQAAEEALGGLSNGKTKPAEAPATTAAAAPARRTTRPYARRAPAPAAGRPPAAAVPAPPRRCNSCVTAPASPSPNSPKRWESSRTTCTA